MKIFNMDLFTTVYKTEKHFGRWWLVGYDEYKDWTCISKDWYSTRREARQALSIENYHDLKWTYL